MLAAGLSAGALVGCGGDTGDSSPEPVDHATTRQAVQVNTQSASQDLRQALSYVRQTDLLGGPVTSLDGVASDCGGGTQFSDGTTTESTDSFECDTNEPVENNIDSGTDELLDVLNERIFVDANIEEAGEHEITYLLDGTTVCVAEDFAEPADRQDCVADVDQVELRLVVTSSAQGDIDIKVLVGPDRYNPLDFELHDNLLAATADLGDLRSAVVFASNVTGEDAPDLPGTMQGKLRAELRHDTGAKTTATFSVLQGVHISDADYDIKVNRASPAAQITVDTATQTISSMLDLDTIDLRMPITESETTWDENGTETTTETSYAVDAHLGGASFDATYTVGDKRIDVQNVGLGTSTSTLDIDQKRVVTVDLNRSHGRHLNFSFVGDENGTQLFVDPAFDLELMLQFAQVQDKLDGLDDWMLDEMMRITFDGANPAMLLGENIKVLQGRLKLSSTAENISHTVSAGQCLLTPDNDAPTVSDSTSDGTESPTMDDGGSHPFTEFSAGACQ
jgi:hypothetical protein